MPSFTASFKFPIGLADSITELYALTILPPDSEVPPNRPLIEAGISPQMPDSLISQTLARRFGGRREGDIIHVTLFQPFYDESRFHSFGPLPITIRFANRRLGDNFLLLGTRDLEPFFITQRNWFDDSDLVDNFLHLIVSPVCTFVPFGFPGDDRTSGSNDLAPIA
jgi:hypothetical protein